MSPKSLARRILYKIAPGIMNARASYYSYYNRKALKLKFWARQRRSVLKLFPQGQVMVLEGPFTGMLYIDEVVWGPIEPKWIGRYESELQEIIYKIIDTRYDIIIDIGSAEGYYSVGLGKLSPASKVYSYDIDPISRKQQRRLADLNGVSNVNISGYCSNKEIDRRSSSSGKTLVFCDIEGSEYDLLDPDKSKSLKKSDIIVELHSFKDLTIYDVMDKLKSRFTETHAIEIRSTSTPELHPIYKASSRFEDDLLDEDRGDAKQYWLWMVAKGE